MECFLNAWQRPTLTGGSPQLPSAQKSLTSVFGMGTGVTSLLSPPNLSLQMIGRFLRQLPSSYPHVCLIRSG